MRTSDSITIIKVPWVCVVRENVGIHLFWKILIAVALAFFLFGRLQLSEVGIALGIALVVSMLTWVLMRPNWWYLEKRFEFFDVKVSSFEGWMIFELPNKTFKLPAFLVRVTHSAENSTVSIRFPISIFYFYSRFIADKSEDADDNSPSVE